MKAAKKQRIVYKKDAASKAAELEEFLFGNTGDPLSIFEREKEGEETVADLTKQASRGGGLLHDSDLFFEDTVGAARSSDDEADSEAPSSSGGGEAEEGEGEERVSRSRKAGRRAAGPGGADEEEDGGGASASDEEGAEAEEGEQEAGSASEDDEEAAPRRARSSAGAGTAGRRGQGASGSGHPGGPPAPVWSDPDDASVTVNVAKQARLRKLRTSEQQQVMDDTEYQAALRRQHQALNPRTTWAGKRPAAAAAGGAGAGAEGDAEDEAEAEALLASAGRLGERGAGAGSGRLLPAGQVETTRLKDANQHQPSDAVVQAVQFHPNGQVLLTAGLDRALRLFQVDGLRNPLLQTLRLADMPITAAAFASSAGGAGVDAAAAADRVVLAGRRPHFYVYDMGAARVERVAGPAGCRLKSLETFVVAPPSACTFSSDPLVAFVGDGGFVPLVSLRSRQWAANLKMSGNVRALAFGHDGRELLSTGDDGVVHVWDLRTHRCRLAFTDSGNIGDASSLAVSADGAYIATGARSGVVNVYRSAQVEAAAARAASGACVGGAGRVSVAPARELMNLTTNVDTLVFSPDAQMLAIASRMKRDALRLVHLPSLTVFANWPTGRSPLHYVHSVDFSPHCGLLTIGNAKGRALLYRLHHYQQA